MNKPKGNNILVHWITVPETYNYNWLKNSRNTVLHYNVKWRNDFAQKKNKGLAQSIELANEMYNDFIQQHSDYQQQIEADLYQPIQINDSKSAKSHTTTTNSKSTTTITDETTDLPLKLSKKKRYYTQNDLIELLNESGLDFTTQQIAYIIRLYNNEVRSKKDQERILQAQQNNIDHDDIEQLPRPKITSDVIDYHTGSTTTTTTTQRQPRQFYSVTQDEQNNGDETTDEEESQYVDNDDDEQHEQVDQQNDNLDNDSFNTDNHDTQSMDNSVDNSNIDNDDDNNHDNDDTQSHD